MSYDVRTGLSGAASGASAGSAFGPVGTAVGGALGLASGFLGGGDKDEPLKDLTRENRQLLSMLRNRFEQARDESPLDSTTFQAQFSAAQEQTERQADRDAASAAARGLTGSQFEIAQQGNRTRSTGRKIRRAAADASRAQRQRERQALLTMLDQRDAVNNLVQGRVQADRRQGRAQNQQLFSAFSNLAQVLNTPSDPSKRPTRKSRGKLVGRAQRGVIT